MYGIGTSQRVDFTIKNGSKVEPGPGKYNPKEKMTKMASSAWVIGTEQQRPGSIHKSPGPGQYSPNEQNKVLKSPSYRIGTSQRMDFTQKDGNRAKPGPGNYTPKTQLTSSKSQTWMFGSQQRAGTSNKLVD